VASAQYDRGSGPLEREVEAAAQRAALRAVRDLAVDAGLEAGDVRWQVRGAPAHGEAADAVVGGRAEAAQAVEREGAARLRGLDPQHVRATGHPVGRLGPVDHDALDGGALRAIQAAADVDRIADDPGRWAQEDLAVHGDQVAGDDALDDHRRVQHED